MKNDIFNEFSNGYVSEAKLTENAREREVSDIKAIREKVYATNLDIMDLLYKRSLMLSDIEMRVSRITGISYFLGVDENDLETDFSKNGMRGETVKKAVMTLRNLLFDDGDEKFRKFSCLNIEFNRFYGEFGGVSFEFTDGEFAFDVTIPRKIREPERVFSWGETNYSRNDVFAENSYVGEINIGMYANSMCHDYLFGSLDLGEVRKFIKTVVCDPKRAREDHITNRSKAYASDTPPRPSSFAFLRAEQLSRMLISSGFDYTRS